jgi:hypothetical protein
MIEEEIVLEYTEERFGTPACVGRGNVSHELEAIDKLITQARWNRRDPNVQSRDGSDFNSEPR